MSKQPRLVRDHTLSEEQWAQLEADYDKAAAEEAKRAAAEKPKAEAEKSETNDGT